MSRSLRIAVGGISHESNTFCRLRVGREDMRVTEGADLVRGLEDLGEAGIEWLPLLSAGAMPNGMVRRETYESLRDNLLARLTAVMPVDGVALRLHGAMYVEGLGDGETDLVRGVREVVGEEPIISASLDLHANLSEEVVRLCDIMTAYRTAPHLDSQETRLRATRHLLTALSAGLRPTTAMVKLPMILTGEWAVTAAEPARSLYARLRRVEQLPGMADASICIGCAWTDSPETRVSTLAVSWDGAQAAHGAAQSIAEEVWAQREAFGPSVPLLEPADAVREALRSAEGPVFISDTGDNPTAGAAGDTPIMLRELLSAHARGAIIAGLTDAEAVAQCVQAGVGARLTLSLGGKLDCDNATPLEVRATVRHTSPGEHAVIETGGVFVLLLSHRAPFMDETPLLAAGAEIDGRSIVVTKCGYLHGRGLELAGRSIWASTPGYTDLRLERLPYERLLRPVFPLDPEARF